LQYLHRIIQTLFQIIIFHVLYLLSAAGFAVTLGLYQGVIIHHTDRMYNTFLLFWIFSNTIAARTRPLRIAYTFESIWEAAVFGFGLGFFIVYGYPYNSQLYSHRRSVNFDLFGNMP
jgi:hypothetical protein